MKVKLEDCGRIQSILRTSSSYGEEATLRIQSGELENGYRNINIINLIMKQRNVDQWSIKKKLLCSSCMVFFLICKYTGIDAQDGIAGINEANAKVRSYFNVGCNLMYAVGAILGLIGAIRVYQKWGNGHQDTGSTAAAWFGSCVFLVIVATVLRSFFGL